jgi:hypothetical protein
MRRRLRSQCSTRRTSLASAWRRSTSSTKRTPEPLDQAHKLRSEEAAAAGMAAEGAAEAAVAAFEAAEGAAGAAPLEAAEAALLEVAEVAGLVGEAAAVAAASSGAGAAAVACRGEVAPSARLARPAIALTDAGRQCPVRPGQQFCWQRFQRMHAPRARRDRLPPSLSKNASPETQARQLSDVALSAGEYALRVLTS